MHIKAKINPLAQPRDRFYVLVMAVLFLAAAGCNLPAGTPTALPAQEYTQAAQTVMANLTVVAPTVVVETPGLSVSPTLPVVASPVPSATPTQPPTPTPTVTPSLELLFKDDFSNEIGWYTALSEDFGFTFVDGAYQIFVNIPFANIWSIREQVYTDIVLEVDGARTSGPEDGYYGLVCRHVDGENYYALVIGSNGFYGIGKMEEGEFEFLQQGQDASGAIKTGPGVFNRLHAECIGERLSLSVNGQQLLEIQDDDYLEGNTGLMAGVLKQPGLYALFDNFAVYQP